MQFGQKRSCSARLQGYFLLCHPGPVCLHLLAVTLFTLLAMWPRANWSLLLWIVGAHTAMQLAIALLNDYCDRAQDAVGKPEKPIPRGLVTAREALLAGYAMIGLMLLLLLALPPLAWVFSLLYLALGIGYNLGLKSTPFSGAVFALAMPLIPLYAFAGAARNIESLAWLIPVGFLLGVTLNLANALPDLEQDVASGARTLAVALGTGRAFLLSRGLFGLAALLILALDFSNLVPAQPQAMICTLGLSGLLLIVLPYVSGPDKAPATRRRYFYLMTLACLLLAGGWLIGAIIV